MKAEMDVGTSRKALQINLDRPKYGTFAEIGAGQEVARRFFHVRTLDEANVEQQEALGVIGVNLLYGAFYHSEPERLISSLQENLAPGRIQVDLIKFSGPAFYHVDNRLMSLQLVSQGLTNAVMFTADGETVQ